MRTFVLLFTGLLTGLTTVSAAESSSALVQIDLDHTSRYRYDQPVTFVERGVEFLIFPDGSFDFNPGRVYNGRRTSGLYFESNTRRGSVNVGLNFPGSITTHYGSRGLLITHDRFGNVNRVGNVFLDYDRLGRISRVGSVRISYRHGLLRQVGGMTLQFNGKGRLIHTKGFVNRSNQGCGFCGNFQCGIDHIDHHGNHGNWNDDYFEDDDYYYFRDGDSTKKHRRLHSKKRK